MFNEDGLLEAGIHNYSVSDFKNNFINYFNTSQTRSIIYKNTIMWLKLINEKVMLPEEIWFDGSYVTSKINPNDLDVVLFFDRASFTKEKFLEFQKLQAQCKQYKCDAYMCFLNNKNAIWNDINGRNYWRGQFGFDRQDRPKGIIKIEGKELSVEIKEVS
ncbi:DUF6932 family protein [Clostridium guangxiense]|uniref:DUF6932 family protein n=1 Tax=Clostridium guangxiense TaxID=1662055 RepID=UPI001E2DA147|nr:hypothetical protein [Clostridium guangxiense]MCD2347417.1 hypothetical protein [Clostridium guangxiense]